MRLMTLYQAKGLEFPIVFVPNLLDGEWPTKQQGDGLFPRELLREAVPEGDIHTDEERRLLYVAMTRAQDRLILTTHGGAGGQEGGVAVRRRDPGRRRRRARADRSNGGRAGAIDRRCLGRRLDAERRRRRPAPSADAEVGRSPPSGGSCRCRPPASAGSRCACGRASSSGSWRRRAGADPRPRPPATTSPSELDDPGPLGGDDRRRGARPGPGPADLPHGRARLRAPARTSSRSRRCRGRTATRRSTRYDRCPLQYAFKYVYRMPPRDEPVAAFAFGTTAHAAFEAFTKERRERSARGRAAAHPRGPRARVPRALDADRVRRPDRRGGLPATRRDAARQLLEGRGLAASARRSTRSSTSS